jgi:4-hydroxybenzoate polyprenyltransferase
MIKKLNILSYINIARPDNWFKNIFILPGVFIAAHFSGTPFGGFASNLFFGVISVCLAASANYVINEWLDRNFDIHHPRKKYRPSVLGNVSLNGVIVEYVFIASLSILIGSFISFEFMVCILFLLIMGILYNVNPIRLKERVYLDVLSESINNPIRLLLGWFIVPINSLPPTSLVIAYWMGGAYLMAIKRLSEFRHINNVEIASAYRKSFGSYTEESLLISAILYGYLSISLISIFLVKYKIELILALPFIIYMYVWYLKIGFKKNSAAQYPEQMMREKFFVLYVVYVAALITILFSISLPKLNWLLNNAFLEW